MKENEKKIDKLGEEITNCILQDNISVKLIIFYILVNKKHSTFSMASNLVDRIEKNSNKSAKSSSLKKQKCNY